jgi:hypothetical protein
MCDELGIMLLHDFMLSWCSPFFFERDLHSRLPLVPTPARLKHLHVRDQLHYSRVFTPLTGWYCKLRPNTEGTQTFPTLHFLHIGPASSWRQSNS